MRAYLAETRACVETRNKETSRPVSGCISQCWMAASGRQRSAYLRYDQQAALRVSASPWSKFGNWRSRTRLLWRRRSSTDRIAGWILGLSDRRPSTTTRLPNDGPFLRARRPLARRDQLR